MLPKISILYALLCSVLATEPLVSQLPLNEAELSPAPGTEGSFVNEAFKSEDSGEYCKPGGLISDSCCDFKTVESINEEILPTLHELLKTPFFSHYKINLNKNCPFWNSNHLCSKVDCSVSTVHESKVPEPWLSDDKLGSIDLGIGGFGLKKFERCTYTEKDFCVLEDEDSSDGVIVDLLKNTERFTGYAGDSAAKVWRAVYEENCFSFLGEPEADPSSFFASQDGLKGLCTEKRVFYRILSGLHASISTHICDEYYNSTTGKWEHNLDCFISRVGMYPDRLENMYFDYIILLRAVNKVSRYMKNHSYCTSDPEQNETIKGLFKEISKKTKSCPPTFDETSLFRGSDAKVLKDQFKEHFRNITRVMDCIDCQKCRLWGKIQTSGVGTALKILFSYEAKNLNPKKNPDLFQKTEIVSLLNTFGRVSESVAAVETFRRLYQERKKNNAAPTKNETPNFTAKGTEFLSTAYKSLVVQSKSLASVACLWFDNLCKRSPAFKLYSQMIKDAIMPLRFIVG